MEIIIEDFNLLPPLTSCQHELFNCALHIQSTLNKHSSHPENPPPFSLRYLNIGALRSLTHDRSKCPRPLPSGKALVLVNLAGRLLVINLPPRADNNSGGRNSVDLASEVGDVDH